MLAKCANPSCQVPFRYLHEGKLFVIPKQPKGPSGGLANSSQAAAHLDYYWLCHACANNMRISFRDDEKMLLQPANPSGEDWPIT
jgi:hypothetical protein